LCPETLQAQDLPRHLLLDHSASAQESLSLNLSWLVSELAVVGTIQVQWPCFLPWSPGAVVYVSSVRFSLSPEGTEFCLSVDLNLFSESPKTSEAQLLCRLGPVRSDATQSACRTVTLVSCETVRASFVVAKPSAEHIASMSPPASDHFHLWVEPLRPLDAELPV
jgi:hypothetical protein